MTSHFTHLSVSKLSFVMMKHFYQLSSLLMLVLLPQSFCFAGERSGTVNFTITVSAPPESRSVKLWFPYPTSDLDQEIKDLKFDGNYSNFTISREPRSGALYLYTEWSRSMKDRSLSVTFHAKAKERKVANLVERDTAIPLEVKKYVQAEFWIPSDDKKIKSLAREITKGKKGILQKARAVYDWTVENTRRDPNVPGCGVGKVEATLASRSGKCADISSVFVALARAAGVPAREVFGLRLGRPGQTNMTDEHHCWAEFYLPGTGWVPVDPADVRKIMLQQNLDLAAAKPYRDYYFGAVDEYRIVLQKGGRGLTFSEGNAEKVNYFMYPYAEVDGNPLDYCQPKTFTFTVLFREDVR
jgi:transglutaminase-like putative cysteine protease